jgi:hypothetical protein
MPTALTSQFPTIVDLAKKSDPNGGIAQTVELLAKKNAFLQDIAFKAGNLPTGHKFSARVALPSPTWRKINQGIAASKGQVDTIEETCGMLEGLSKVDCALAELNGNAAAFRADEDNAFVAAFGLEVATALFYASTNSNPEKIHGLAPRFDGTGVASGQCIKGDASASGNDSTSIWLVGWSPDTVFGIYPKNSVAGFKSEDLGKQLVKDSGGTNEYTAYVTHHKWSLGLAVQDYRYVARLHSVDTSAWKADLSAGADLPNGMMDLVSAIHDTETCSPVFYMNRAAFSMFNKQLAKKTVNYLEYVERGGRLVPHFLGFPIRISDAITSTEAPIA